MINKSDLKEDFELIMDAMHDDLLITNGEGTVIRISKNFEKVYGISSEYAIGTSIFQLEREGYFKPSITKIVLDKKKKITLKQDTKEGRKLLVTATPIFNENGDVKFVVSFSRDITEFTEIKEKAQRLEAEVRRLKEKTESKACFVYKSEKMLKVVDIAQRVAETDASVLLLGASGVGKTAIAKLVHDKSNRSNKSFIEINCAAIPESLIESELFGYEKGAFTGATHSGKIGLIELAEGGTLFLDEISELSISLQAKLLKVIQDKKIVRVGGRKEIEVDFRLITASNRELEEMVKERAFRQDLFYRLNVVDIKIPLLKERKEDILPLLKHFITLTDEKYKMQTEISPEAIKYLIDYCWPGNVRELSNIVERLSVTSPNGKVGVNELPDYIINKINNNIEEKIEFDKEYSNIEAIREETKKDIYFNKMLPESIGIDTIANLGIKNDKNWSLKEGLEIIEKKLILNAYEESKTSVGVSEKLGISQASASRKINKYFEFKVSEK